MLWFVLPSVLCLMALAVRDDVVQPLLCVVCQLLRIGDLWAHVGIDVQEVVAGLVRFVSLLLRDQISDVTGSSDGLNLLL